MTNLPTGTVTFLRTDVEGSMGLARTLGASWDSINDLHMGILRAAIDRNQGIAVRTEGDAMFAVFPEAGAAVRAAVEAQVAIDAYAWPANAPLRVRMGIHSGEAHLAGDDYGGFDVNRAARISAVGHGGQIIVSETTAALVAASLPPDATLHDLGRHILKDIPTPEHLYQLDIAGRRTEFPPIRVARASTGNLPERSTSLIGRASELTEVAGLVDDHRLVTLTGPGGIGKTSLALEVARSRASDMPDGAWFVPLDRVSDPVLVGSVIARTLGLFDGSARAAVDALPDFLADRSVLLVLDNFEHLLDAAPDVVALLQASPRSRFLVTSRAPLRISGEQEYPVPPLPVGGEAAVQLFVERARSVRPAWEPGAGHADRRGDLHAPRRPAARHRARRCQGVPPAHPGDP